MRSVVCALVLGTVLTGSAGAATSFSGRVVDAEGKPVAGARVFIEPGVTAGLLETKSAADGAWRIEATPSDTTVGLFALAEGLAFGGATVSVASEAAASDVTIELGRPASLRGQVTDAKNHPVKGARITRVGLLTGTKVGIPLAKLKAYGPEEPVSDDNGNFVISRLPEGGMVALKVAHPEYAQEAVDNLSVGDPEVHVTLYRGALVEGEVRLRNGRAPVSDIAVVVRNAQPPYDTAVTKTNAAGSFALRLKPGAYLYQAVSPALRSAGLERLTITRKEPLPRLKLYVAGVGQVRGKVQDAVSGKPVAGAKLSVETQGKMASVVRTGPSGEFMIPATEGESVVRLDAAPGYQAPEQPALRVNVVEGKEATLPCFWLAPLPSYTVEVIDAGMTAVPGAVVTMLRPLQFGWHVTDVQGRATIRFGSLPADGTLVGMVEHATERLGALFAFKRDETGTARVQLFPVGAVKGRIVTEKGKPVEGAAVAGLFGEDGLTLWRTVSRGDGTFEWPDVIPQVPQQVIAYLDEKASSQAAAFTVEISGSKDLGDIVVADGMPRKSLYGKPLAWHENRLLAGTMPERKERKDRPAVVMYCSATDAPMVVEGITAASSLVPDRNIVFAVVVDGPFTSESATIPVLSGKAPGPATTYLIGPDGVVRLETFGLPPVRALQRDEG